MVPDWIIHLAVIFAVLLIVSLVFIVLLRYRVHTATRQLKKREVELQDSNNMIRLLLDSTAEAIYGLDLNGICTFCNAACVSILGYKNQKQLIGKNMHDLIHHSHADGTAIPGQECKFLKGYDKKIHSDNEVFWRADGSCFPAEYWSHPIRQGEKVIGLVVSFVDITERKRIEDILIEQKNAYQSILSATHDGFLVTDRKGNVLDANPAYPDLSGYNRDELLELRISDLDAQENPDEVAQHIDKIMAKGSDLFESKHRRKDGTVWPVEVSTTYSSLNKGRFFVFIRDISERKKAQKQQLLAQFSIEETRDAVFWIDEKGFFKFVNATACRKLSYSREELLQMSVADIDLDCPVERWQAHFDQLRKDKQFLFETRHQDRNGNILYVEISANYFEQDGSEFNFAFVRDISLRKQSEWALQQKNEEIEQFVYSISHDLKSPLVTVKSFLDMLRQDLRDHDQEQIDNDIYYIEQAAGTMNQLLEALLEFSRVGRIDQPTETKTFASVIDSCLAALAGPIQNHQIDIEIVGPPVQLHGVSLHFGQLWQNLIENAIKYMGDQSRPRIEIGVTQQNDDVVFYVRDNGMGIAPEDHDQIFKLFSQLNPASSPGTGLGLAMTKKIVSIYQGGIWVESEGKGQGSCFYFTLPAALPQKDQTA